MSERCAQEMCPNWTGDGRVCACVMLGLEPPTDAGCTDDCPDDCMADHRGEL
jgi:hypothetical protein